MVNKINDENRTSILLILVRRLEILRFIIKTILSFSLLVWNYVRSMHFLIEILSQTCLYSFQGVIFLLSINFVMNFDVSILIIR